MHKTQASIVSSAAHPARAGCIQSTQDSRAHTENRPNHGTYGKIRDGSNFSLPGELAGKVMMPDDSDANRSSPPRSCMTHDGGPLFVLLGPRLSMRIAIS